jgi:hypothetical protein
MAGRNMTHMEWERYFAGQSYHATCPDLPIHPSFIEVGRELARAGDMNGAVSYFQKLLQWDRHLRLDPKAEAAKSRDSRGVRRALSGDINGAIEDFQAFIAWTNNNEKQLQRQRWIEALRAGEHPFTSEEIEALRKQ